MKLFKIKDLKSFNLLLIPSHSGIHTKTYSLNFGKIILYLAAYTLLVVLIATVFFYLTPAKYLFIDTDAEFAEQREQVVELNEKVILLTRELENISKLNSRLKNAILLADSTAFNKKDLHEDSAGSEELGGNIFHVIKKIFVQDTLKVSAELPFFIMPINSSFISKNFDSYRGHMGMDFVVKKGTPIKAAAGGYVAFSDYSVDDGYKIILIHSSGFVTVYKHCSVLTKKLRDKVVQGEIIALSGNSGKNTTGPHLHFEIWLNGQVLDPKDYLLK